MRSVKGWVVAVALAVLAGGPSAEAQSVLVADPTDKVEAGVNWTRQVLQATGVGVAPPYALSAEHGRALAITAGTVLARQELLAILKGVRIDSVTTVEAAMVTNATSAARVSGLIRGAQVVGTRDLGGGTVEVTVAVPVAGELADILLPRVPPRPPAATPVAAAPSPAPAPPRPGPSVIYTGLVIDARGLGVKPAMAPKVLSEGGQEIYGFSVVDRNWVIQQGMAGYSKELTAAQSHERVANRPLTVKAMGATGANKTDVVIANTDAHLLVGSGPHLGFLEKARVMLVVD